MVRIGAVSIILEDWQGYSEYVNKKAGDSVQIGNRESPNSVVQPQGVVLLMMNSDAGVDQLADCSYIPYFLIVI